MSGGSGGKSRREATAILDEVLAALAAGAPVSSCAGGLLSAFKDRDRRARSGVTTKGRTTAKVIFLHGLEGSPNGTKAKWLRKHFDLVAPEMDTSSVDAARPGALGALQGSGADADLLIGSSFGGAMAMRLVSEGHWSGPVVLLAPAVRFAEDVVFEPEARVAVVHGRADKEVLWPSVLERFAQAGEGVQLFLGGWEHRLSKALDDGSIRRAIHWALDFDVLSRGELIHERRTPHGENA